ncbi:protein phosphatase 1, regulatory (inhibitor) subunit 14Aa [Genypterus blacodes]|uniref:protein phosphatase 1, regulatory (inhibitor) subunit 14Aa n=1 Tax=Genypterus blacodes TaxID=154954 RepID=UPI003F76EA23
MATDGTGTTLEEDGRVQSADFGTFQDHGCQFQKRQARVTVKYNRKELQRRLDVEKWIDECLDQLYSGQEDDMPEEVNIDDLIDLPNDEERVKKLQEILHNCNNNTEPFIKELVGKLDGVHKQDELQSEGIEHPVISHSHFRHEPYHFNNPLQHARGPNQTL